MTTHPPDLSFESSALSPALREVARELGYSAMTPVQAQAIPMILAGRDLIVQSRTGSGKTAAFGFPILQRLMSGSAAQPAGRPPRRVLQSLVLCPTRELCA